MTPFYLLWILFMELKIASTLLGSSVEYCHGRTLQGNVAKLQAIRDCDVIEGNLIFFFMKDSESNWQTRGALKVKEITGFLMLYDVENLTSLDLVFPNLTVIRGSTLYKNYALVIYGMLQLKELKLPNLKSILRGAVNIQMNPVLSYYARKINWNAIAPNGRAHNYIESLEFDMSNCNPFCAKDFCWSYNSCQAFCPESCSSGSCINSADPPMHECCHERCLGGCNKPNDDKECFACEKVHDKVSCLDHCGMSLYELDGYRCIDELGCLEMVGRKLFNEDGVKKCVKECPSHYYTNLNNTSCQRCEEPCPKTCPGGLIDSISAAQSFHDCVIVDGSLQIRILKTENIIGELEINLKDIKEIRGFLHVFESNSLTNLEFLKNLNVISGNDLWQGTYSLVIKDNDNLRTFRKNSTKIELKKGDVAFYRNSHLCPEEVEKLLGDMSWLRAFPDIKIRKLINGFKAYCHLAKNLTINAWPEHKKGTVKIEIEWLEDDAPSDLRKLVGFQIYYRKLQQQQDTPSQWLLSEAKFSLKNKNLLIKVLTNLVPNTTYEIYAESFSTGKSVNNLKSKSITVTTNPFNPGSPRNIHIENENHVEDQVRIEWSLPAITNGYIDHYVVSVDPHEDASIDAEDVCNRIYRTAIERNENAMKEEMESQMKEKNKFTNGARSSNARNMTLHEKMTAIFSDDLLIFLLKSTNAPSNVHARKKRGARIPLIEEGLPPGNISPLHPLSSERTNPLALDAGEAVNWMPLSTDFRNHLDPKMFANYDTQVAEEMVKTIMKKLPKIQDLHEKYLEDGYFSSSEKLDLLDKVKKHEKSVEAEDKQEFLLDGESPRYISHDQTQEITKINSIILKNLTEPAYTVKVWACQTPIYDCPPNFKTCKLCSTVPRTMLFKVIPKEDEIKVQRVSANVSKDRNVVIAWSPPINKRLVLAYDISLAMEHKTLVKYPECQSASLNTEKTITDLDPGNYSVTVTAFTRVSSITSDKISFYIEGDASDAPLHNIKWAVIIILPCLVLIFFYVLRRNRKIRLPDVEKANNPEYAGTPHWKEYFERVIDPFYRYPRENLRIIGHLDQGNFGIVQKGFLTLKNGREVLVAAKQLKQVTVKDYSKVLLDEASIMTKVKSYHLVKTYGVVSNNPDLYLVMEYMDGGDLLRYLDRRKKAQLPMLSIDDLFKFAIQIADGMSYLEQKGIIHRDLAARNCLLDRNDNVKVSDFGLARLLGGEPYRINVDKEIAERRMPPECFLNRIFTSKSDVWSYGVLLWELVSNGSMPYSELSDLQVRYYISSGQTLMKSMPHLTPCFLEALMIMCWRFDIDSRPTFSTIVSKLWDYSPINDNYKNIFRNNSFHFKGEHSKENEETIELSHETAATENEIDPSTPLTTPQPTPPLHSNGIKGRASNPPGDASQLNPVSKFVSQYNNVKNSIYFKSSFPFISKRHSP